MPVVLDARPLVDWIVDDLEPAVRRGPGRAYARRLGGGVDDVYGTADMACVLHTVGRLDPDERATWQGAFDALQDPGSGHFVEREPSHLPVHATAFCVAAMALVGLRPAHPLTFLGDLARAASIDGWLAGTTWDRDTYLWSHEIAGIASLAAIVPEQFGADWTPVFLASIERYLDPATGMFGRDKPATGDLDQVGGTFHHLFVHEHHHRRLPGADARVRTVLALQGADGTWDPANPYWLTLDGIYLLTRSVRDADRAPRDDVRRAVERAVAAIADRVRDPARAFAGDLGVHSVTAIVSALAEAQRFLGTDAVTTESPLRLVLDRRPFV